MTSPGEIDPRYPTGTFTFDPDVTPEKRRRVDRGDPRDAGGAARRGARPERRAGEHAVSRRRLDGPPGRAPRAGKPHERVHALQAGADGRQPDDQAVRRRSRGSKLGDVARTPIETSLALLEALHERWVTLLEVMTARGLRAAADASGERPDDARPDAAALRAGTARTTSRTSRRCARVKAGSARARAPIAKHLASGTHFSFSVVPGERQLPAAAGERLPQADRPHDREDDRDHGRDCGASRASPSPRRTARSAPGRSSPAPASTRPPSPRIDCHA